MVIHGIVIGIIPKPILNQHHLVIIYHTWSPCIAWTLYFMVISSEVIKQPLIKISYITWIFPYGGFLKWGYPWIIRYSIWIFSYIPMFSLVITWIFPYILMNILIRFSLSRTHQFIMYSWWKKILYFVWSPPWHLYILLLANLLTTLTWQVGENSFFMAWWYPH